ncbi:MAG: UDP-N-acetylmuramoyl-tripeptide-D-alanyl-D-alanine ligase [Parcubacteria group bacterium GW2011_GWB1_43_6]|nr:MAG: UDP-N-acetylmuramoyl-tripeptide-D-alanyl-D-alanine ligase [Parcubacteria group bacterium GW2011_GWB1_43_6]
MKMNNTFNKIKIILTKPKVILVAGRGRETAARAISQLNKDVLIYQVDAAHFNDAKFLLKNSRSVILVATHMGEYEFNKEFFAGQKPDTAFIEELVKNLPAQARLVLNFDDETIRDIKSQTSVSTLSFGFGVRADIQATDIFLTQSPSPGTNFKINYEGNIVPVWLKNLFGKEHIYAALASVAVGELLGLNLVEISAALKSYQGFPGRMKLIEGIKNTLILDDSESASPLSMAEALDVLKRIEISDSDKRGRKIAVLGDIVGAGQYTPEIHETIGEEVKVSADLLFTVGLRAKFYAEGAKKKGLAQDKIFSFNEAGGASLALQQEMKEGDFILIDGSRELQMIKIVDEIRKI